MIQDDYWDITNRPHTRTKLRILRACFGCWLKIWNKQNWISNELYVLDLFSGRGYYLNNNKKESGSPLIFLEVIKDLMHNLKKDLTIKLFFIEKKTNYFIELKKNISSFLNKNSNLSDFIEIKTYNEDCNNIICKVINQIINSNKNPLFVFVDPYGIKIEKDTIEKIVNLNNRKDIIFNYILEGVTRTSGIAKKAARGENLNCKEISTLSTLLKFIGDDISVIGKNRIDILTDYVKSIFTSRDLKVVIYNMPYPDRKDTIYYLLFASKNPIVTNIVKDIYAREKLKKYGRTLFGGKDYYTKTILEIDSRFETIKKRTLLYKTKVEYGNWTINHILGCLHGCKFPCYAMMMAKKFGWVKNYNDWRNPRIVENALELLRKEIPRYRKKINFVHLSFMSDPFMYDFKENCLVPEIKKLTLEIIKELNQNNIKVTILTKGYFPDEIFNKNFSDENEYGITLVSLNKDFKSKYEPFSAPYDNRINSLKRIHEAGLKTWVSIEPYPTPNLDPRAYEIEKLLEKISFVDKLIFGKLNYNTESSKFISKNEAFYNLVAKRIIEFCNNNEIKYHIKFGTPYSVDKTKFIFNSNNEIQY